MLNLSSSGRGVNKEITSVTIIELIVAIPPVGVQ